MIYKIFATKIKHPNIRAYINCKLWLYFTDLSWYKTVHRFSFHPIAILWQEMWIFFLTLWVFLWLCITMYLFIFLKILFIFRERKGRERNINVWLTYTWASLGTWPATKACALTGNQIGNPLVLSLCSIYWATPARLKCGSINMRKKEQKFCLPLTYTSIWNEAKLKWQVVWVFLSIRSY